MKLFATLLLGATFAIHGATAMADDQTPRVRIETSLGAIVLELDAEKAAKTVENFLSYVDDGFFDGLIFHRVIPNFMIQGGGFTPDMNQKPTGAPIQNEANNGLKNAIGTIAMARTQAPHSATAQFFINLSENKFLDHRAQTPDGWGYAVFGQVVEGMDVVMAIAAVQTARQGMYDDVPREPVVISKVTRITE